MAGAHRIAVLGAGANGAAIGADLAREGLDVTLIEQWPDHTRAMRELGVTVITPEDSVTTEVRVLDLCEVATLRRPFDVVLMLLKAYDSTWGAHLIAPHLADDGLLVGVQNGMTVDAAAAAVGTERTMGAVIEITSSMFDPGVVRRDSGHDRSWFAVGSVSPATSGREEQIAGLLRHSGSVDVVDDILSAKWMKIVSNSTTLVTSALLGLSMREAVDHPAMREVMVASGTEALRAGIAAGHSPLPIFGLAAEDLRETGTIVDTLLDTLMGGFVLPTSRSTVLQDWLKGRRSEARDINGRVVAVAAAHGLDAPVNRAVVELASEIERGEATPGMDHLVRLRRSLP